MLNDGLKNSRTAIAELVDGAPRAIDSASISDGAKRVRDRLEADNPGMRAAVRETGRYMRASLIPPEGDTIHERLARETLGDEAWRLIEASTALSEASSANTQERLPKD